MRDVEQRGHLDLEASEIVIRAASHRIGGSLLEKLLNADGKGYGGVTVDCGKGHRRLKLSGMHWTVKGANAIIALRCCQMSDRWEEFWESRATG